MNEEKMYRSRDIREMFSMSDTTLWRRVKDGTFPKPAIIGRMKYWKKSWIDQLMNGVPVDEIER